MPYSLGIVGLPNAGKSTLFSALSRQSVAIPLYPFTTIDPNRAVIAILDERLDKLAEILGIAKRTPATIEVIDIAGLVKGAHQGEGLGNQFLAHIRETDVIIVVLRNFVTKDIADSPQPKDDLSILETELIMKDLETAEKEVQRFEAMARSGEKTAQQALAVWKDMREAFGRGISAQQHVRGNISVVDYLKEVPLLSAKPMLIVLNGAKPSPRDIAASVLDAQTELDAQSLSPEELRELGFISCAPDIIAAAKKLLSLITFFTAAGGNEIRSWLCKTGTTAVEAAAMVHSDFAEKFIKCDALPWHQLVAAGGFTQAREKGLVETQGREYTVQDGDVLTF